MNKVGTQELIRSISGFDFERFVLELLVRLDRFDEIRSGQIINGIQVDIIAKEKGLELTRPTVWYIETSAAKIVSIEKLHRLSALLSIARASSDSVIRILLVAAGTITNHAKDYANAIGVEVWDGSVLSQIAPSSLIKDFFFIDPDSYQEVETTNDKIKLLSSALKAISPGREYAMAYQQIISSILEFLFCPPLETPNYELPDSDARNRRDMIFENAAPVGFWASLRTSYAAHYIVIDAKNYSDSIDKAPVVDIAHYLKPYGCGMFGILVTRQGASPAGRHAMREQWIGNQKMIICLSDLDLIEMLQIKLKGGAAEEIIRSSIAKFRMSL